ncbi:HdeD family acid-resistance protein [Rhodoplanes elegans]|uniref:HdeD family acid-resistance protein n=1 Tax=Rhodoplanes elegans TaxID=29408 RepID=UPI000DABB333|nr:DUF308 domain-containing protein [Rhodoplanes elegans]
MMTSSDSTNGQDVSDVHSALSGAGLARNWWAIAIRAVLAAGLAISLFWGPTHTFATLVVFFAIYVAADGAAAIAAGLLKMKHGEAWRTLIFEGALNLFFASAILVWPAIAATAFVRLASIWAVATGSLLLAAARRTSKTHVQGLLALAGLVSIVWGLLLGVVGPLPDSTADVVSRWLIGYALAFAVALLVLSGLLRQQHRQSTPSFH